MTTVSQPAAETSPSQVSLPAVTACVSAACWTDAVRAAAMHLASTIGPVSAIARAQGASVALTPTGPKLTGDQREQLAKIASEVFLRPEGWAADAKAYAVRSVVSRPEGQPVEALVGFVTVAPSIPHLTAVSAALSAASSRELSLDREREAETAGRVVDLVDFLAESSDESDLHSRLAQAAREVLKADLVAVAVRKGANFALAASDPLSSPWTDDEMHAIEAACDEVHIIGNAVAWPPVSSLDRPTRRAIERATKLRDQPSAWAIPLEDSHGQVNTILFAWHPKTAEPLPRVAAWWNPTVASAISAVSEARATWWMRLKSLIAETVSGRGLKLTSIALFATAVIMAIPMPYKPKCECRLAPSLRRFVAAPFDATLKTVHVEPGDVVEIGSPMADLDEREIDWELAAIEAELQQANKRRSAALATASLAEAQIAEFDGKRLEARRDLLVSRSSRLAISAPMAGIVVDGDLTRAEGMPLEMGQSLFEIAPLERFVCEIHVPEFDVNEVAIGQHVAISLDAQPSDELVGVIQRIRPQAEPWEDSIGFVVEVEVDNETGLLRPGMTGQAKITTAAHPIGRNLFHRAYGKWRRGW